MGLYFSASWGLQRVETEAAVPAVDVLLQLGQGGIGIFHLGVVELVGGVDVVPDVGDGEHGVEVGGVLVHLDEHGVGGLKALGGVQPCGGVGEELLCRPRHRGAHRAFPGISAFYRLTS